MHSKPLLRMLQRSFSMSLFKETFSKWLRDKAPKLAAALAYYTVFSLPPLLLIVIAIAGLGFGQKAVRGEIVEQIQDLVGQESAQAIESMIENASHPASGIIATIVGLVMLLLGSSGVFGKLQDSLNIIWQVKPKPTAGLLARVKQRFVSFTMVLGSGFLLLVSLIVTTGLAAFGKFAGEFMPGTSVLLHLLNFAISFVVITSLFAMIYKVLPDVSIRWRDVWIGAAGTALLFTLGKFAIGMYLGHANFLSTYGTASSAVVILVWVYYSAQILLFGAEFTQVYTSKYGTGSIPKDNAVPASNQAPTARVSRYDHDAA